MTASVTAMPPLPLHLQIRRNTPPLEELEFFATSDADSSTQVAAALYQLLVVAKERNALGEGIMRQAERAYRRWYIAEKERQARIAALTAR